jgi:thiamine phosphate synthase YjbQ (UPF0047 family)
MTIPPTRVKEYLSNTMGMTRKQSRHITASVSINDEESRVHEYYEKRLERLAPRDPISHYIQNFTGEDNGDAHLKRQLMGASRWLL